MKKILILPIFVLLMSVSYGQIQSADGYMPFYETSNTAKFFKMGNSSYLDYYLEEKVKFGNNEYYSRIRMYSWGDTDTSYFREDDKNYYHFDPKANKESIVLPKTVMVGHKWLEADGSWSYEIISIDEKLATPAKKYSGLIVVECLQLTGKDKEKSQSYHIYYAKGLGMVGSVNDERLTSYLAEVKKNAKKGEKIGD